MKRVNPKIIFIPIGILIFISLWTLPYIFIYGIDYFKLNKVFSKIGWEYFHFISIYATYLITNSMTVIGKVKGWGLKGKYQNHFFFLIGILLVIAIAGYFGDFTIEKSFLLFGILILPTLIGISSGIEEVVKMTDKEKEKINQL